MSGPFAREGNALLWRNGPETVRIEPWGRDSLRVRATVNPAWRGLPAALRAEPPATAEPEITLGDKSATVRCGKACSSAAMAWR